MSSRSLDTELLRSAIAGLILHAAAAEAALLEGAGAGATAEHGDASRWAAAPLIAHNTEFKRQQVHRLDAILAGETPHAFAEIDHHAADYYDECGRKPVAEVAAESQEVTAALLTGLRAIEDEDLLDPTRHPWLRGRQLALQVIVRGFWHPLGHVGDYCIDHGRPETAFALHEAAIAEAQRPGVPRMAQGMAYYSLGCAQARNGAEAEAVDTLKRATSLNPDLVATLAHDRDLEALRSSGSLEQIGLQRRGAGT